MLKLKLKYIIVFLILILATSSCIKDVDFDQADNLVLTPVVASSAVFTNIEASRFSDNGTELEVVADSIANIEIFGEQFVIDNLVKAELFFEATNTINRTFGLQIDFKDDANTLLHTLSFTAQPSTNGTEVISETSEVFEDGSLDALKLTTRMVITFRLFPSTDGSTLSENSTGQIILKSRGIFYLNLSS